MGKNRAAGRDPGMSRLQAGDMAQPHIREQSPVVCYWTIPRLIFGGRGEVVIFFLKKLGILLHLLIDSRSNAQECGGAGESSMKYGGSGCLGERDGGCHKRSQPLCGLCLLRAWDSDAVFPHRGVGAELKMHLPCGAPWVEVGGPQQPASPRSQASPVSSEQISQGPLSGSPP